MNQKQILLKSLEEEGFSDDIINAFSSVKREDFIPLNMKEHAYDDNALPIGEGQTISQPYTIATMLSLLKLKKGQKVLEVGSGCGYVLALLSELVGLKGKVFGIEVIKGLYDKSIENLKDYENVNVYHGDGNLSLKEKEKFDRILISAASDKISKNLVSQLKDNGIIVAPIGEKYQQSLMTFRKKDGKLKLIREIQGFIFVPLVDKK